MRINSTLIYGKWLTISSASKLFQRIRVEGFVIIKFGENAD